MAIMAINFFILFIVVFIAARVQFDAFWFIKGCTRDNSTRSYQEETLTCFIKIIVNIGMADSSKCINENKITKSSVVAKDYYMFYMCPHMCVCLSIDAVINFPLPHAHVEDNVKVSLRVETRMVAGRLVINIKALTCSKLLPVMRTQRLHR